MKLRFHFILLVGWLLLQAGCVPRREAVTRLQFAIWGTAKQAAIEQAIAAEFERAHPDVKVDVVYFSAGYQEKMQSMMVGGTAPDVLMVDSMVYGDWGARGALLDVTGLVQELDAADPFMPLPLDIFRLGGAYYALPVNAGTPVMFYNREAFTAAGVTLPANRALTWAEFEALGPKLSRRAGNTAAPTDYFCVPAAATGLLLTFGVQLFDDPARPTRVTVRDERAVAAVECQRRLYASGWAAPSNTVIDEGANQLFRDRKVAVMFTGRYMSTEVAGSAKFAWDIAPMPRNSGGVAEGGGTALAIAAGTRVPELAREFLRFYASPAAVAIAARGGRIIPVRRSLAYGADFLALQPPASVRLFSDTQEAGAGGGFLRTDGLREIHDILYKRMEQAVAEPERPAVEIVQLMEADLERWVARRQKKGAR